MWEHRREGKKACGPLWKNSPEAISQFRREEQTLVSPLPHHALQTLLKEKKCNRRHQQGHGVTPGQERTQHKNILLLFIYLVTLWEGERCDGEEVIMGKLMWAAKATMGSESIKGNAFVWGAQITAQWKAVLFPATDLCVHGAVMFNTILKWDPQLFAFRERNPTIRQIWTHLMISFFWNFGDENTRRYGKSIPASFVSAKNVAKKSFPRWGAR